MNDINSLAHSNANYQSTNRQILDRNKPILRQALLLGNMLSQTGISLSVSFVYRTIKYQYEPVNKNNTLRDKGHIKQFKGLCYCSAVFLGYSLYIPDIIPERLKQLHAMKRVGRVNEHIIILSENIGLSYPECRQRGVGGSKRAVAEGNAAVFLNERQYQPKIIYTYDPAEAVRAVIPRCKELLKDAAGA